MRKIVLAGICALAIGAVTARAQGAPKDKPRDTTLVEVSVTGCVKGEMLVETRPSESDVNAWKESGDTYRLKAPKAIMRTIKASTGRLARVKGTLDTRQLGRQGQIGGVPVGKRGRFVFGKRESTDLTPPPFSATLTVTAFTPSEERCH